MPWKNGGGMTTEILVEPRDADEGNRFVYRASIADVTSNGPFSTFAGYDRHIMLLSGAGMTLEFGDRTSTVLQPFEPYSFSGDAAATGILTSGPVRDFNVIVDRASASASLRCRMVDSAETIVCKKNTTCILHVLEGALDGAKAGETIVVHEDHTITPRDARTRVVHAEIWMR